MYFKTVFNKQQAEKILFNSSESWSQSPLAVLQQLVFPFRNLYPSMFFLTVTSSQLFLATRCFFSHLSQSFAAWLVRAKHWIIRMSCWGGGYSAVKTTRCYWIQRKFDHFFAILLFSLFPQSFVPSPCYHTTLIMHCPPQAHWSSCPYLSLQSERIYWQGSALCWGEMCQQHMKKEKIMLATSCLFSFPLLVDGTEKAFRQHHASSGEKDGVNRNGNRARSTGSLGDTKHG